MSNRTASDSKNLLDEQLLSGLNVENSIFDRILCDELEDLDSAGVLESVSVDRNVARRPTASFDRYGRHDRWLRDRRKSEIAPCEISTKRLALLLNRSAEARRSARVLRSSREKTNACHQLETKRQSQLDSKWSNRDLRIHQEDLRSTRQTARQTSAGELGGPRQMTHFNPSAPACRGQRQQPRPQREGRTNLERDEHDGGRSNERLSFRDVDDIRLAILRHLARLDWLRKRGDDRLSLRLCHTTVESARRSRSAKVMRTKT